MTCFAKYTYTQNAPTVSSQFSFLISWLTWNGFTLQNHLIDFIYWNHLITLSAGNCKNCMHSPPCWEFGCLDAGPALIWWRPWGELWESSLEAFPHFSWEQDVSSGSLSPASVPEPRCRYACAYVTPWHWPASLIFWPGLRPVLELQTCLAITRLCDYCPQACSALLIQVLFSERPLPSLPWCCPQC